MAKEVWVKKTIWRRYLVEDDNVTAVTEILKHDESADEIVADCYDFNGSVEYDNEEIIMPIQYEVKAI